jgi:hypothetical protein
MENALRTKIVETRQHLNMVHQSQKHSRRGAQEKNTSPEDEKKAAVDLNPIVLVGWNTGAVVCAQVCAWLLVL